MISYKAVTHVAEERAESKEHEMEMDDQISPTKVLGKNLGDKELHYHYFGKKFPSCSGYACKWCEWVSRAEMRIEGYSTALKTPTKGRWSEAW